MKGTGLEEIIKSAFSDVKGMLDGNTSTTGMRDFRTVATALLEQYIVAGKTGVEDLQSEFEMARSTQTARLWVDFLMPTILIHLFLRSARLSTKGGCLEVCIYRSSSTCSSDQHVCQQKEGVWKFVSTDPHPLVPPISTSVNKRRVFGRLYLPIRRTDVHSLRKIQRWSCWHDIVCILRVTGCHSEWITYSTKLSHVMTAQAKHTDRQRIRDEIGKRLNPLNTDCDKLFNIINGHVASDMVNVQDWLAIGNGHVASDMVNVQDFAIGNAMVTNLRDKLPA